MKELRSADPPIPLSPTVELFRLSLGVGKPPGECILVRRDDGSIAIKRADPKIWVPDVFLKTVVGPEHGNPWVHVTWQHYDGCDPEICCQGLREGRCYFGAILTIRDGNATVMYKIHRFLRGGVWEARLVV